MRFDHKDFTHTQAVGNTLRLFEAARQAGIERVVHVSITNPSLESALPYFRGKAQLEAALRESGLSYAILRPTVLFGREDILINNIAWMLRRFPVFGVFGDGHYKLQPIFVDDLAQLAVEAAGSAENAVVDAIGPETFTYRELVSVIGDAIGRRRPIVSIPPALGVAVGRLVGMIVGDVVVTREEVAGLMQNLLVTSSPPAGRTALSQWILEHRDSLGRRYSSELARRRNRRKTYEELRLELVIARFDWGAGCASCGVTSDELLCSRSFRRGGPLRDVPEGGLPRVCRPRVPETRVPHVHRARSGASGTSTGRVRRLAAGRSSTFAPVSIRQPCGREQPRVLSRLGTSRLAAWPSAGSPVVW